MLRVILPAALLAACSGLTAPGPSLIGGLEPLHESERSCLVSACSHAATPESLQTCRQERCAHQAESWTLEPTAIRHAGETVFVQASLRFQPMRYGFVIAERPREAYVGVTVVTSTGEEIDLAVTTIFAEQHDETFTLSTDVGPDVRDVIFGVWDRKIAPCDSERSGCKEFGFLLDGSLATWPPTVYLDGTRQRIPPAAVDVLVLDAGAGSMLRERRSVLVEQLSEELSVFGAEIRQVRTRRHDQALPGSQVVVADAHDMLIARNLSAELSPAASPLPEVSADAPFVFRLGGTEFGRTEPCAEQVDTEYDDCLAGLP